MDVITLPGDRLRDGWTEVKEGVEGKAENADAFLAGINNYFIFCTWRNDECGEVGRGSVQIKDED